MADESQPPPLFPDDDAKDDDEDIFAASFTVCFLAVHQYSLFKSAVGVADAYFTLVSARGRSAISH